jgi:superfamily II DNA or RNA helicase
MSVPTDRSEIPSEITALEEKLTTLKAETSQAEEKLTSLRDSLQNLEEPQAGAIATTTRNSCHPHQTPEEKVELFRDLFRGRDDIYPLMWVNQKTGKKGYSPACDNEWIRGVCNKPRIKCGECPNQSFVPVTSKTLLDHLKGRHIIGVYPLLRDETCWFLAVDFDKASWKDDVSAFARTCHRFNLPVAVERSQSGNGAHAWFFFEAPVPAMIARKMGCFLITETMSKHHQLSMSSYDRLFPNQDTMPKGGFGNLIALPLQYQARQKGNTLFLDENLMPYPDQWAFLASIRRIPRQRIEEVTIQASSTGQILGIQASESDDDFTLEPWFDKPATLPEKIHITEPVPAVINVTLSQRLYIDKTHLPSPLINQIKRIAAFQNPEFYKKQAFRLSTAMTPRIIACAEDHKNHVSLPRGCLEELKQLLEEYGINISLDDIRTEGVPVNVEFKGKLSNDQDKAAKSLLLNDAGVFVAPPGTGKTVLATYLIAARKCSTLILVHRQPLLEQWRAQLELFLDLEPNKIGMIGGGKKRITGNIDIAMIQSVVRQDRLDNIADNYGQIIVDECHHLPAVSFERVLSVMRARYLVGLTATPRRRDGHQPIIHMQLGPVRYKIDAKSQAAKNTFNRRLIIKETDFSLPSDSDMPAIQELYRTLATDHRRNDLIINDVIASLEEHRSPIVLSERKDHLEYLYTKLKGFAKNIVVLRGGRSAKEQREIEQQLHAIAADEERLLLATGRYIGEGFDDARLDTLFLTLPVSWRGILVQYAGRLHRSHPDKHEVRIVDYADNNVVMLHRMFHKRLTGYLSMGYRES